MLNDVNMMREGGFSQLFVWLILLREATCQLIGAISERSFIWGMNIRSIYAAAEALVEVGGRVGDGLRGQEL